MKNEAIYTSACVDTTKKIVFVHSKFFENLLYKLLQIIRNFYSYLEMKAEKLLFIKYGINK